MKSSGSKFALILIFLTTILSVFVGGFATIDARNADLKQIDITINSVVSRVKTFPTEAISAAILTVEEESFDLTLSLVTQEGEETIINESNLSYSGIKSLALLKSGLTIPISVAGVNPFRFRAVAIADGDYLVIASSLDKLNKNFNDNLRNLIFFTILADALAIFFTIFFFRRHNRGLDSQALERMQSFLSDASHELRTPLTVIKGYNEMLSKGQFTEPADQARAFLRVSSEIERMESLIRDLLLLAELGESKTPAFTEVNFDEILQAHINDFRLFNLARTVTTNISTKCVVQGSPEHLNRLIQNILSNIVRHTPESAPVSISLQINGKKAELLIEDGGPGLPNSGYIAEIKALKRFDPARSRESGGSGLGLSIIGAIVQEHRGELNFSKSQLGGLAISIQIPL